jgi:CRP/FNR family transcriptional regulator, cyclic AMP receptor protein
MEEYVGRLKEIPLFSSLREDEMEPVLKIAQKVNLPKGAVVFREGEKRDTFSIILDGKVKICVYDDKGREYILDILNKDGFFGELSLFEELSGFAQVVTMKNTDLLMIRRGDFMTLLSNHSFAVKMVKELAKRLREANEKLKGFAFLGVEGRILQYLMDIGMKSGLKVKDRILILRGPSQGEMAAAVGCSRETVSRMIKSLVDKGRISVIRRQYTLRPVFGEGR